MNADLEAIAAVDDAHDTFQIEVIEALVAIGEAQMAGSAGAAGSVTTAPSRIATPMFNPGKVHRLSPTQIPQFSSTMSPKLGGTLETILVSLLLEEMLEAIGRTKEEAPEERRKVQLCVELGQGTIAKARTTLSDASKRAAIITDDNAPRKRRVRKSNKN